MQVARSNFQVRFGIRMLFLPSIHKKLANSLTSKFKSSVSSNQKSRLSETKSLTVKKSRSPAGTGEACSTNSKTHLLRTCSFSNRKNRRKDGGIYSLSILQAEASGIHDGRWFGGGRCRCCQDARHRLQGQFGTCFSILVSCCHSTKILPPHVQPPGGQVEITPYFLETRMQSGRRPFDDIIDRYWTGYLGEFCDASA